MLTRMRDRGMPGYDHSVPPGQNACPPTEPYSAKFAALRLARPANALARPAKIADVRSGLHFDHKLVFGPKGLAVRRIALSGVRILTPRHGGCYWSESDLMPETPFNFSVKMPLA
jgi:hypothetical protein